MTQVHIIGIIVAAIVGIILALVSYFFTYFNYNKQKSGSYFFTNDNKQKSGSYFFTNDNKQKSGEYQHGSSKQCEIQQLKEELNKLQTQINEANSHKGRKQVRKTAIPLPWHGTALPLPWHGYNDNASTITSGYDYKTALGELDITDFDLINEWDRRNTSYEASEEAIKFQQRLTIIDKTLECDDKQKINEALIDLNELCFKNPEDCELLYRIGMAHVKLAEDESEEIIKEHTEQGIKALETALILNKKHAEVNKWYAISLGLRCQYASISQKMHDGILMRKHCELACALKPDDALLYYILGRFDYEIACLGCIERTFARQFLGDYVDATFEDALKNFQNAERYSRQQNFSKREKKENKAMIAKTLIKLNKNVEAVRWLREAKKLGNVDVSLDQEVNTLLQKYQ